MGVGGHGAFRPGPWLALMVVAYLVVNSTSWPLSRSPKRSADAALRSARSSLSPMLPKLGAPEAIEPNNQALNDIGDPFVLPVPAGADGRAKPGYVLYWTTDWTANVPTAVSTDLIHWKRVPDALPVLPGWAVVVPPPPNWREPPGVSTLTWGPTVQRVWDGWVLYFSTRDAATHVQCLGAAFATSPLGPFTNRSRTPLVCQSSLGGDIDPSVVTASGGHLDLVWKNNGNAIGVPDAVWEQPLTANGMAVTGTPRRLLEADQGWEHGIIEGPSMLHDPNGGWWLFFAGGYWQSDTYDTGIAWCATPAGPCVQPNDRPWLASTATAVSPGGFDTFVGHDGRRWASYSAFPKRPADARAAMASPRVLELAPILSA
jgi:Glycosyl hydrolases family 43